MKHHLPLALICTLTLASCAPATTPAPAPASPASSASSFSDGNVGAACTSHEECVTPAEYMLRSSCPFSSRCIAHRCAVVCPMRHVISNGSGGWESRDVACHEDSDCDCAEYAASDLVRCACFDQACWAIVREGMEI